MRDCFECAPVHAHIGHPVIYCKDSIRLLVKGLILTAVLLCRTKILFLLFPTNTKEIRSLKNVCSLGLYAQLPTLYTSCLLTMRLNYVYTLCKSQEYSAWKEMEMIVSLRAVWVSAVCLSDALNNSQADTPLLVSKNFEMVSVGLLSSNHEVVCCRCLNPAWALGESSSTAWDQRVFATVRLILIFL